jgi:hypothetical protein
MSSLIPETIGTPKKKTLSPQEQEVKEQPILHANELIEQMKDVLEGFKVSKGDRKAAVDGGYRTRAHWATYTLKHVQNYVSARIWNNMVVASLEGMHKTIVNAQPNGDWKIMEYEVDTKVDGDGEQQLCYGCQWVDMANQEDLFYRDGHPAINVSVSSQLPPELVEALAAKGASTDDGELKTLLTRLIEVMLQKETGGGVAAIPEPKGHTLPPPTGNQG